MTKNDELLQQASLLDFAGRFREAFDRLDRLDQNYVTLLDLRRELPDIPRDVFDAGFNQLRRIWEFTADPQDGRHGGLAQEYLDAGIREAGSILVWVARRNR